MSRETDRVIAGFMRLSPSQQETVRDEINAFTRRNEPGKQQLKEQLRGRTGIDLGPLDQGGCPCCGK